MKEMLLKLFKNFQSKAKIANYNLYVLIANLLLTYVYISSLLHWFVNITIIVIYAVIIFNSLSFNSDYQWTVNECNDS